MEHEQRNLPHAAQPDVGLYPVVAALVRVALRAAASKLRLGCSELTNAAGFPIDTSIYTTNHPHRSHHRSRQFTDWALFGREIQYEPHGKIHTMVAGVWGNKQDHYWEEMGFEARIGASIAMSR